MLRLGLITCQAHPHLPEDDQLLLPHLTSVGFESHCLVWDDPQINWASYDLLLMRAAWDYHHKFPAFLNWLERLNGLNLRIWNPLPLMRQNLVKTYLHSLAQQGLPVVDTHFAMRGILFDLADWMAQKGWEKVVVKPAISASGDNTHLLDQTEAADFRDRFHHLLQSQTLMIQPFYPEIKAEGEYTFVYFGGQFSHALRKLPAPEHFLVQEAAGGKNFPFQPGAELLGQVQAFIGVIPQPWLYARVDGLIRQGQFILMELELVEPSLYLSLDLGAPRRFVDALNDIV